MDNLLPLLLLCVSLATTRASADTPTIAASYADNLTLAMFSECTETSSYTSGSAFQANLDALLSSLPDAAAASSSGFAKNFTGAAPDQAYGLAQCRSDITASDCRACLELSAQQVRINCSLKTGAMIVYEGCLLRYSTSSFFGQADPSSSVPRYWCDNDDAIRSDQFPLQRDALMQSLVGKASGSPRMFAVGVAHLPSPSYPKLYGMARCTQDLSRSNCNLCLTNAVGAITKLCGERVTGRILYRSCSIRFQVYAFYDAQASEAAMSPAPAPAGFGDDSRRHTESARKVRTTALLVSVPVAIALLVLLLVAVYICNCKNRKPYKHVEVTGKKHGNEEMGSLESVQYDLSTLQAATDNFSEQNKLGQGAFGPVYKGKLQSGQEIAVKRLSETSQQGPVEMKNEIVLVANLQHKNLVRLLGYCIEQHERLLVYEFLSNKSLDKILYGPARQGELRWEQRYRIIDGIGRGLMYLHEDSRLTIIHRDLKPGNILLDADMNPKISDFGLAKLFKIEGLSIANTNHVAGTRGYMAPEYVFQGIVSAKTDVFSYGVLVLEIITGRRPSEDLLKFVWKHWSQGTVPQLFDSCSADEHGQQEMLRCIHIGLLCVQDEPQLRPRMAAVVLMLNSRSMMLTEPTEPVFAVPGERLRLEAPEPPSINEASISDLEPR